MIVYAARMAPCEFSFLLAYLVFIVVNKSNDKQITVNADVGYMMCVGLVPQSSLW